MSFYKVLLLSGAAAFVSSAALAGGDIPLRASDVVGFKGVAAHNEHSPLKEPGTPLCGTKFGAELSLPDGLISWKDTTEGTGIDTGGGADFTCSVGTKIKKVWLKGFGGTNPEQFNVTFYQNDRAGGSDEPNDDHVACAYTGLIGAGGGDYGNMPKLKLPTPCKFKAGKKYWVEVQNTDTASPWYWEMSSTLQGTQGDWVDRSNYYGDGCTTLDNDEYLQQCLGYTYPDYMLELH